ncbi:MAG: SusC/RagA family TonB-linked outer membrane protein [Arachidicoccus sp.]|nr:SusC/RagA family TonB-linked outer membrane protein [Arachidicoccus sp.]
MDCPENPIPVKKSSYSRLKPKLSKSMKLIVSRNALLPRGSSFNLLWKIMRLTVFFLFITVLHVCAKTYSQRITIHQSNISVHHALDEIKKQTGYSYIADRALLKNTPPLDLNLDNASLPEALQQCLRGLPYTYTLEEEMIVIKRKPLTLLTASATDSLLILPVKIIQGRVTDSTGTPLVGAAVKVRGTNNGALTDSKGNFNLSVPDGNAVIEVSFVGYATASITVGNERFFTVRMTAMDNYLNETIMQAYGTTSRRLNTGNIVKVDSKDIDRQPVMNPLAALDGLVPGLVVTQTTGLSGGAFKVQLRGRTAIDQSLSDDQPLFVVDGVPLSTNNGTLSVIGSAIGTPGSSANQPGGISPFNSINPKDIESIEVLKDADATAIYGSRGANGVVLITTKKGKVGKTKIDFNTYAGFSRPSSRVKMMNTQQYIAMRKQAFVNDGVTPTKSTAYDFLVWDTTRYTDFAKLLAGNTAHSNDAELTISGGTTNTQFFVGGGYHRETTIFPGNFADNRGSMHVNINHSSNDQRFKMQFSSSYSSDVNKIIAYDISRYTSYAPNLRLYDSLGNIAWNEGGYVVAAARNPLAYFLNNTYNAKTNTLLGNLLLSYEILKGLIIRSSFGYNTYKTDEIQLYPMTAQNPANAPYRYSTFSTNNFESWIIEPQAEYKKQIAKGKLNVLIGGTWQSNNQNGEYINATGYGSDALMESLSGASSISGSRWNTPYKYSAFFGRVNYNWEDKYLINLTTRRDGSSRFAPQNRFANFGAIGAGWIFSNESLFKENVSWLSFGKLRASYGVTGNDKITDYQYLDTWASSSSPYGSTYGLRPGKLYNPDYHWEKNKKAEVGLELGFLQDKILVTTSYYNNRSSNQLVSYNLPITTGFASIAMNMPALVENSGWELTLNTSNIKTTDFKWTTSANISIPRNKLLSFPDLATSSYYAQYIIGKPLNIINRYTYTGVDPTTGLYTVLDKNKDGQYTWLDYSYFGTTDPKSFGGLQNTFNYKGWQLDFAFSFRKQIGLNYLSQIASNYGTVFNNLPADLIGKFWTSPGDQSKLQRVSRATSGNAYQALSLFQVSNGIYSDASFVRLRNAALSYNIAMSRWHISNARIYVQGQNLFTITGYKIGDPETQNWKRTPPLRTFIAGIQILF